MSHQPHHHHVNGHTHPHADHPGHFHERELPLDRDFNQRAFTVGVGGPVGSGKTTLVEMLCKAMRERYRDFDLRRGLDEMRRKLGELLDLERNTLVLCTSDNGPVLFDGYHDGAAEEIACRSARYRAAGDRGRGGARRRRRDRPRPAGDGDRADAGLGDGGLEGVGHRGIVRGGDGLPPSGEGPCRQAGQPFPGSRS